MNDQYRVGFHSTAAGAEDVEIVDYHWEDDAADAQALDARRAAARGVPSAEGLSQYRLAKEIGVPAQRFGEIVAGRCAVTAYTDLRLCRFFGFSNGYWLRAQAT